LNQKGREYVSQDPPPKETWQTLEEKLTFLERETEHLREQQSELWKRLTSLEKGVEQMVRRMEERQAQDVEG
jgi:hypothetical protein